MGSRLREKQEARDHYNPVREAEGDDEPILEHVNVPANVQEKLDVRQTAILGFQFGLLWV